MYIWSKSAKHSIHDATAAQLQINCDSRNLLRFCNNVSCADSNHRVAINEMYKHLVLSLSRSS